MTFFEPIRSDRARNSIPIVLIDISGSTKTRLQSSEKIKKPNRSSDVDAWKNTIRDYEFKLAHDVCKANGYDKAHVICWSDTAKLFESYEISNINEIFKETIKIANSTHLMSGLELIDYSWLDENKITDVFIITDGEIQDSYDTLSNKIRDLCDKSISIQIIAVEPDTNNYLTTQCSVGNALYRMIRNHSMSRFINRFSIYNELYTEFVNLSNPTVPNEYVPFRDTMFKKTALSHFINHVIELVTQIKNENGLDEKIKHMKYMKLAHEISLSVYYLTRDKTYQHQMSIIDLFSNMFKDADNVYCDVRKLLLEEVNNHMTGKSTTFTDISKNKYQDLENTNISLMQDVNGSIIDKTLDSMHKYSFLIRDGAQMYVIRSTNDMADVRMGKVTYKNSGVRTQVNDRSLAIPIMFRPDLANKSSISSSLQWLLINYARVLNVSPSNEYIYYYFLADAYIVLSINNELSEIGELYRSYVKILLDSKPHGSKKSIIQNVLDNMKACIPYYVLESCASYAGLNMRPLTLFYLLMNEFIVPHFTKDETKQEFMVSLATFCEPHIKTDLPNIKSNTFFANCKISLKNVNDKEFYVINSHKFSDTNIDCGSKIIDESTSRCTLCGSNAGRVLIEKMTLDVNFTEDLKRSFYLDESRHVNLGQLDGEKGDEQLIIPETFIIDNESVELSNIMIVDPISSSSMRVKNQEEFVSLTYQKYPFLKDLDFSNVALCGGFVRSILLKQQMKDFDFFFYGLDENDYRERFYSLAEDLINNIRKHDPKIKFGMFFKPMFNVFELICFEDPTNHIDEEFTLENFDQYKFKSLKKYRRDGTKKNSENDEYYFEDNDDKGIKMRYRIQFILCKYESIHAILKSFDMYPSKVAFDGKQVYFTQKSLLAYRHMINEISLDGGSDLFKSRLSKYFKYGFSIVLPPNDRKWTGKNYDNQYNQTKPISHTNENIGPLSFKVRSMIDNIIYINHNSNIEKMLERNQELEQAALDRGVALYMSSLFCSFVSFLRYVSINKINYLFPQYSEGMSVLPLDDDGNFVFKTGNVDIKFIECFNTLYKDRSWYEKFYKSLLLTKFE